MILSIVCIIILSILLLSGKLNGALTALKINSVVAMGLLLLGAIACLIPQELMGLDMLGILLLIVAIYCILRQPIKRIIPIFSGMFGVALIFILFSYVTAQMANSALIYALFVAIMGATLFIVSQPKEVFVVASLGMAVGKAIIYNFSVFDTVGNFAYIGAYVLSAILAFCILETACLLIKRLSAKAVVKSKL